MFYTQFVLLLGPAISAYYTHLRSVWMVHVCIQQISGFSSHQPDTIWLLPTDRVMTLSFHKYELMSHGDFFPGMILFDIAEY